MHDLLMLLCSSQLLFPLLNNTLHCITYDVQFRNSPYMSTSEYDSVVEKYDHMLVDHRKEVAATALLKKQRALRLGDDLSFSLDSITPKMAFFNDYNSVESFLIFSSLLTSIGELNYIIYSVNIEVVCMHVCMYVCMCAVCLSLSFFQSILYLS